MGVTGGTEMQDAMDLIYQAALAVGRAGAVSTSAIIECGYFPLIRVIIICERDLRIFLHNLLLSVSFEWLVEGIESRPDVEGCLCLSRFWFYVQISRVRFLHVLPFVLILGPCLWQVEELMGNVSNAAVAYAKAAAFFYFLLVEAPYLPLNPPLVLSSVDRQRLRRYADAVTIRQNQCTAQREAIQEQQQSF